MINDWVQLKDHNSDYFSPFGKYHKVDVLDSHTAIQMFDSIFEERLEPIKLTEEMLKVNGFEKTGDYVSIHENGARFETYGNHVFSYRSNVICDIFYVHELQHALRLCGLNDLADNFKL